MAEGVTAAKKSFYCELCNKGYNRVNEYDAHLSSYDHSHKKRLQDMKQMQKDPSLTERRRERERRQEEKTGMITIKPIKIEGGSSGGGGIGGGGSTGFKKGGFKSAFGAVGGGGDTVGGKGASEGGAERSSGGFKKVFLSSDAGEGGSATVPSVAATSGSARKADTEKLKEDVGVYESDTDEGYERYDPAHPTS